MSREKAGRAAADSQENCADVIRWQHAINLSRVQSASVDGSSMHPWDIFDICHELCRKYRLLRAQAPAAPRLVIPSGKVPSTRSRPKLNDYLVDFELAGPLARLNFRILTPGSRGFGLPRRAAVCEMQNSRRMKWLESFSVKSSRQGCRFPVTRRTGRSPSPAAATVEDKRQNPKSLES